LNRSRLVLPKVIGHRGAPKRAPENTLAGFEEAHRLGVAWVELDVQLSRDLVPVVFHDWELERTSTGEGRLTERDSAYLRQLDVGSWFGQQFSAERLPSFEVVLELLIRLGLGLNIEIKAEDDRAALTAEKGLAQALGQWPRDRPPPLVTSFSRQALAAAREAAPEWPRGLVSDHWPKDLAEVARQFACSTIHVAEGSVDEAKVRQARELGLEVLVYVVDDPRRAHQLWQWGVASVFSDRPEQLL
jgi:glycerophosphoryl diester phosphodiesterase